ncbi:MAG: hypothetical protein QF719_05520 [Chloroflexota bacterium]|jgi:hypothetical protein|nr:hypothetical protein [Chloroflexota bacterium]MDP6757656.1 hypothetical protein [Chloroflexota bacterium]
MFPFIFFIGTKKVTTDEGDLGLHVCPTCEIRRPFRLRYTHLVPTLFFVPIPMISFFHRYYATCNHCGHGQPVALEEVDEIARFGGVAE